MPLIRVATKAESTCRTEQVPGLRCALSRRLIVCVHLATRYVSIRLFVLLPRSSSLEGKLDRSGTVWTKFLIENLLSALRVYVGLILRSISLTRYCTAFVIASGTFSFKKSTKKIRN